jgi:hypothetical protein
LKPAALGKIEKKDKVERGLKVSKDVCAYEISTGGISGTLADPQVIFIAA